MLKVAIPNKGALSEGAIKILSDAGYRCQRSGRELSIADHEHDVEFLYLRPRDIAVYVSDGIIDAGITGRDLAQDSGANLTELLPLNFGCSRFFYAGPAGRYVSPGAFGGLRIATSYPEIVRADLLARGVEAEIIPLDGAVEISIQLGVADVIADVVDSGRTLREMGLETIGEPLMRSEAVLVTAQGKAEQKELQALGRRMQGILVAREYCLLEYVAPKAHLDAACAITPGVKSPTLSPVHDENWMAVAAMVKKRDLNRVFDELGDLGARGIIAHEIHTCRL